MIPAKGLKKFISFLHFFANFQWIFHIFVNGKSTTKGLLSLRMIRRRVSTMNWSIVECRKLIPIQTWVSWLPKVFLKPCVHESLVFFLAPLKKSYKGSCALIGALRNSRYMLVSLGFFWILRRSGLPQSEKVGADLTGGVWKGGFLTGPEFLQGSKIEIPIKKRVYMRPA